MHLESAIRKAKVQDRQEHSDAVEAYVLAKRVTAREPQGLLDAISKLDPLSTIGGIGTAISLEIVDGGHLIEAKLEVHGEDVVPSESKSLLKSGKLSVKQLPKSRFYEYYQDYVCGAALRVANELLAAVPVDWIIVTAVDELLNSSTGHMETAPILSVAIARETMEGIHLDTVDPSDCIEGNFVHKMAFKKTKGFSRVDCLSGSDIHRT